VRRARWAAAIVATAAVALTACSGAPAPAGEPGTLAAYYAEHLNWQPCDGGFECAQFVVPFDYAKPDGRRFTLPVVKLPAADPAHRVGALVINPGGPGGSGVQYALGARLEFRAAVLARFDIAGFDPRRVRALVLDGSVDPATSSLDATIAQAQGFQGAFGSFAAWCLAAPGCPLGGSAGSSVAGAEARVEALITRSNSAP
jgi:hypothetical protein